MRVLTIVHETDAGPGVFADVLASRDVEVEAWLPAQRAAPDAEAAAYGAIMTFGGSMHPHQEDRHPWLEAEKRFLSDALAAGVPLLGICLGAELIAEAAGGRTRHMEEPEIGWCEVVATDAAGGDALLAPLRDGFEGLEWHSYAIEPPPGAAVLARTSSCVQGYRIGESAWGFQFHAEVTGGDFQNWLDNYATDPDAVAAGIDPARIARDTAPRMSAWNGLGRGLCARFLDAAAER